MIVTTTAGVRSPGAGDSRGNREPAVGALPYPTAGRLDLAAGVDGAWRPAWDHVMGSLLGFGGDELDRRQRAADRLMAAEGASAVLNADVATAVSPWRLDIVPFVMDAAVWAELAAGLVARAQVLTDVVADLQGPRRLLQAGVIPIEALAGHTSLLASSWGAEPRVRLCVVGADVVVDGEGRARVAADVTDVPSGDGHALLARSVSARVLPPVDPSVGLVPHRAYTAALRATLAAAAPSERSSPRAVVVTGAPDDPGYVEDSYLATQLGYDLAERADVAVRDGRVWLRSLDGLEPVDVLLRRVPETAFDPVEDAAYTGAGVAGAVEVERGGGVAIVNPHGSGAAASVALQPFLDEAARFLTGRPLDLPSVPTLWCGDPDRRRAVESDPGRYVLHDTDPRTPAAPAVAADLSDVDLATWLARIAARPERYVAQEVVSAATAPRLVDGGLRPVPLVLRTQVALAPDGPVALPGGHARLLDGRTPFAGRPTGTGKDVWVLDPDSRDRRPRSATRAIPQIDLRRSLPTRAAEAMYWTGRMAERAEMAARTAVVALTRVAVSAPEPTDLDAAARALRAVSGGLGEAERETADGPAAAHDLDRDVRRALGGRAGAVVPSLRATVANARTARQLLSARTWNLLTLLDAEAAALDRVTSDAESLATFDITEALDRVLVALAALAGLANETVVRGPGWRFFDIGRRLERALLVLGLVEALFEPAVDDDALAMRGEIALAANESLVAYRRRHRTDITLDALGDLLLADRDNPRSVRFQLDSLALDLHDLPDRSARRAQLAAVRSAQHRLDARLPLGSGGGHDGLGPVGALVVSVRQPVLEVGDLVPRGWFSERPRRVR